jgi:hypothetical protein
MMTDREREEIEKRIADYERENGRLAAQIVINTRRIAELRWANCLPGSAPMAVKSPLGEPPDARNVCFCRNLLNPS